MSLATWLKEFYPVPASECSKEDALDHSIRKWRGLLPRNLKKHGVRPSCSGFTIRDDDDGLPIDDTTCALCHAMQQRCKVCPIGGKADKDGFRCGSAYETWLEGHNPRPMLALLRAAKRKQSDASPARRRVR